MAVKMRPDDPAYWMLSDGVETTPVVHNDTCYICRDPEFAQMGLPLCRKCPACGGHIAADDTVCDNCGLDDHHFWEAVREGRYEWIACVFSTGYPDYEHKRPTDKELDAALSAYDREIKKEIDGKLD
jgi:hypothetical protein